MELTYDKLIMFDLAEQLEASLLKNQGIDTFMQFQSVSSDIEKIDEFIKESPSFPGSTDKIIRSELVSVVGATLAIEGTQLDENEIEIAFNKADLKQNLQSKEQEAENSRNVYNFIRQLDQDNHGKLVYNEQIIKQIHKYFTENMNYLSNTPGLYRTNFIATFGSPRKESLCRTDSEIGTAMLKFVEWLNREGSGFLSNNKFVKAIMAHYFLSEIHPFGDGNGRTARALEALVLYNNGINHYCFWSLANFWSTNTGQYLTHLDNVRRTCNPKEFLIWGMEGYRDQIAQIKSKVLKKVKKLMFLDYVNYLLANKKKKSITMNHRMVGALKILVQLDKLPFEEFLAYPGILAIYGSVNPTTRWRDFKNLIKLDLINFSQQNGKELIEPNFKILDTIIYNV